MYIFVHQLFSASWLLISDGMWRRPGVADLEVVTEDPQRSNAAGPHGEGALPESDIKINGGEKRQKRISSLHPGDCEQ